MNTTGLEIQNYCLVRLIAVELRCCAKSHGHPSKLQEITLVLRELLLPSVPTMQVTTIKAQYLNTLTFHTRSCWSLMAVTCVCDSISVT
jgi:hypothetical protein